MDKKLLVLSRIAKALNDHHIVWAVGASGMLYLNGITDTFHDLDIMVSEECIHQAKIAMSALGQLLEREPTPQYRTKHFLEYVVDDVEVDVMAGFVIVKDGVSYPAPFDEAHIEKVVTVNGQSVPLQFLSDWERNYTLMGRPEKAQMCVQAGGKGSL